MKLRLFLSLLAALLFTGCDKPASAPGRLTIGVAFETLQTEYWVAGFEAIKAELAKRDMQMLDRPRAFRPKAWECSAPGNARGRRARKPAA